MTRSKPPSDARTLRDYAVPAPPNRDGGEAALSSIEINDLIKVREGRWQPGLAEQPLHSEIFTAANNASGTALALALARDALRMCYDNKHPLAEVEDRRQVLWVQDARAVQLSGRPYLHGLPDDLQGRVIHVAAERPEDALFALEEGLKCRDMACVIGEIAGNPRALDFTASRRLSLAAHKHSIALWLVRIEARRDLSSARMRWQASPAPSTSPRWNRKAPGAPAWQAELFRAARYAPGQWTLTDDKGQLARSKRSHPIPHPANIQDHAADIGHLVRPTVGRSLATVARA